MYRGIHVHHERKWRSNTAWRRGRESSQELPTSPGTLFSTSNPRVVVQCPIVGRRKGKKRDWRKNRQCPKKRSSLVQSLLRIVFGSASGFAFSHVDRERVLGRLYVRRSYQDSRTIHRVSRSFRKFLQTSLNCTVLFSFFFPFSFASFDLIVSLVDFDDYWAAFSNEFIKVEEQCYVQICIYKYFLYFVI